METMDISYLFLSIIGAIIIYILSQKLSREKKESNLEFVGHISKIVLFPGKGMKGIRMEKGYCTKVGLKDTTTDIYDRCLIVFKGSDNRFVSSKMIPKMVTLEVSIKDSSKLEIKTEDSKTFTVSLERNKDHEVRKVVCQGELVEAQDCGEEAATWISECLQTPGLRMAVFAPGLTLRKMKDRGDKWTATCKAEDELMFNNTHPYMMASLGSLDDLNSRLEDEMIMCRFRPNFIVAGSKPFDEDTWSEIRIGDLQFSYNKPCQRCPSITVCPEEGEFHKQREPHATLNKYRDVCADYPNTGVFGALLTLVSSPGRISVGDAVYVNRCPVNNGLSKKRS